MTLAHVKENLILLKQSLKDTHAHTIYIYTFEILCALELGKDTLYHYTSVMEIQDHQHFT